MITDVVGVTAGHWTDRDAVTGCTVVLFPEGSLASAEVRGGAPATREFELLHPQRTVARIDAVVMSGGSAFGLATADGVMRWCAERGQGFPTAGGPVPIVVGMSLFDLLEGQASAPDANSGYAAAQAAHDGPLELGRVGAGVGATVDKWRGRAHRRPGGLVSSTRRDGDLIVSALVALNAWGEVLQADQAPIGAPWPGVEDPFINTTLVVVATNARLTKGECALAAQGGSDGVARAVAPAHASGDGDAVVAVSVGAVEAPVDQVRYLACLAVADAIRSHR